MRFERSTTPIEVTRTPQTFWANVIKDQKEGGVIRVENMYWESILLDLCMNLPIPEEVYQEYEAEYRASLSPYEVDPFNALPPLAQENIIFLNLLCEEVVSSAGLKPSDTGDAFGDDKGKIFLKGFKRRYETLIKAIPYMSLGELMTKQAQSYDWFVGFEPIDGKKVAK